MENVSLDILYRQLLEMNRRMATIDKRLGKMEEIMQIPEEEIPPEELKKHKETVQRMREGKEGISWTEFKSIKSALKTEKS